MTTMVRPTIEEFEHGVDQYLKELDAMEEDEAREYAKKVLIETGVLDANGNPKKQIVTGDFFGW